MRRNNRKLSVLSELSDFFRDLSFISGTSSLNIIECISLAGKKLSFVDEITDKYEYGCNIKELWKNVVSASREIYLIDKPHREIIMSFPEMLGKCDKDEFCKKCIQYSDKLKGIYDEEKQKSEKSKALTVASGFLAAAAMFIILI